MEIGTPSNESFENSNAEPPSFPTVSATYDLKLPKISSKHLLPGSTLQTKNYRFSNHYVLTCAGVRFFSVHQGYNGAEDHKGEYANVIAPFADDIAHDRALKLYGDGTQTRDFTHVNNVLRGLVAAAENELDGIYNLGTGERVNFNTTVGMINDGLGTSIDPEYVENPIPEDVYIFDTCADHTKISDAARRNPKILSKTVSNTSVTATDR